MISVQKSAQCDCFEFNFFGYKLMMQKRDVILTAVFSSLAALILIAGIGAGCYFFHKRRRKRDEDENDSQEVTVRKLEEGSEKKSRVNGFLSLKTPLISSKTLG
ncbi:unnamed protein product [Phyllotreta striolata]|uniref:Uncharacterized protein n=1 Tax=Phyllotreta striolata TaxID=444603 RepID=A0A9N9TDG4_PHYSR|nr:unnamed protein product [Phyllotreta striolata]